MSSQHLYTRRQIEARIASGDTLVIFQDHVLRLNAWQDVHPGGSLVIQHMVGRDATDELSISHSLPDLESMKRFRIGKVEGVWKNFIPPIQGGVFRSDSETDDDTSNDEAAPLDRASSQAVTGWKVDAVPNSYAATAIQETLDADLARYPSIDAATQHAITLRFRALHQRVLEEGYYECRYSEYAKELARYSLLFAVFLTTLHWGWYATSGISLGLFWQQIMFTGHDAGHRGITHNYIVDTLIGIFIGNLWCGLSIGWWKSSHNVHHFVTNDPVHDPDTQNIPLFTISPAFFSSIRSSYYNGFQFVWNSAAEFTVKYQKWTYYPIMTVARYNLYYLSWLHLASRRSIKRGAAAWVRPTEVLACLCYIYLFFYLLCWRTIPGWKNTLTFLFTSHAATLPLQIQITLSHWGTSTSDFGATEAFAQRQLRTTLDVDCPEWLDFIHGGLQFQAEHHLFPRVPRHNLRKLQVLVREFCEETGIQYQLLSFVDGNRHVLSKLQQITDQAKILAACSKHMAATGNMGHH